MIPLRAAVVVTLLLAPALVSAQEDPIRPSAFRAHVEFLGSDLLEGRDAGTRGYDLAAAYVAAQFGANGLAPAGDDGTFFQAVPLRTALVVPEESELIVEGGGATTALVDGEDWVPSPDFARPASAIDAPAVFVGYGVSAPAFDHDDYAGIDVDGKVVVTLYGAPPSFPPNPRAHYTSFDEKAAVAAARGAVGIVTIFTPEIAQLFPWAAFVASRQRPRMRWLDASGAPGGVPAGLAFQGVVSMAGAERLFAAVPTSAEEAIATVARGERVVADLGVRLRGRVETRHADLTSPNVLARREGADPALADEIVVYTAHVDHVGIGTAVDADSIYNGVFDNAAGVAALLEVARAFAAQDEPPRRSILFFGTAAEEKGLLGADYFVHEPLVPIERIAANINLDGNIMAFPSKDFHALGSPHSSLGPTTAEVAAELGAEVLPDPMPEQTFFIRSDQYPFIKAGVPAVAIINAFESTDPAIDGRQAVIDWLASRYHKPSDDLDQPIHWEVGVAFARLAYRLGLRVADDDERPSWNPGDFFGETFGR